MPYKLYITGNLKIYTKIGVNWFFCFNLGIQHAVGGLASKPERDLLMQDFMTVETTNFPNEGSNHTPAHHYSDFKYKNYAPIAFRYFRDLFGIQPDDFLVSISCLVYDCLKRAKNCRCLCATLRWGNCPIRAPADPYFIWLATTNSSSRLSNIKRVNFCKNCYPVNKILVFGFVSSTLKCLFLQVTTWI